MLHLQRQFSFLAVAGLLLSAATADARNPEGRFVVGTDPGSAGIGVVFDQKTGLTWQRSPGPLVTQSGAGGYCHEIGVESGTIGWRLPTLKEIISLIDYAGEYGPGPLVDDAIFPNTPAYGFWSSTTSPARPAQCVDFTQGFLGCYGDTNYVRCVR